MFHLFVQGAGSEVRVSRCHSVYVGANVVFVAGIILLVGADATIDMIYELNSLLHTHTLT